MAVAILGKAADTLVDEAVSLSSSLRIPKVVVGATLVSLGTTAPEVAVSVLAAINGTPGIALGNAVGSVICDTGLILGLACLLRPLPIDKALIARQGNVQFFSGVLLVMMATPWSHLAGIWTQGGRLDQQVGWMFLVILVFYIWASIRWTRGDQGSDSAETSDTPTAAPHWLWATLRMVGAVIVVIACSEILLICATELARRLGVPESVIAATMIAFGTSLPELVTAITAVRRNHGELAVGNVIGADILNVLFVAGAAAAVTPQGLAAGPHFFRVLFPSMIAILLIFRVGVGINHRYLPRSFGGLLLGSYLAVTFLSYGLD